MRCKPGHIEVEINMQGYASPFHGSLERRTYRIVHELGHSLNLWHPPYDTDVMYEDTAPVDRGIFYPTFDAIDGASSIYGRRAGTLPGNYISGAASIYRVDGFPTALQSSASSGRANAYETLSVDSNDNALMVAAQVVSYDLNRFGVGFFDSANPASTTRRIGIVELDSDGVKGVVTAPGGGTTIRTLGGTPSEWSSYWLQVSLMRLGASSTFWVAPCAWKVDDRSFIGCTVFHEADMSYGNVPPSVVGGLGVWGTGSDYRPHMPLASAQDGTTAWW